MPPIAGWVHPRTRLVGGMKGVRLSVLVSVATKKSPVMAK